MKPATLPRVMPCLWTVALLAGLLLAGCATTPPAAVEPATGVPATVPPTEAGEPALINR